MSALRSAAALQKTVAFPTPRLGIHPHGSPETLGKPLKNSRSCRRRGHETLISWVSLGIAEPPDVGSYFFNGLLGNSTATNAGARAVHPRHGLSNDCPGPTRTLIPSPLFRNFVRRKNGIKRCSQRPDPWFLKDRGMGSRHFHHIQSSCARPPFPGTETSSPCGKRA